MAMTIDDYLLIAKVFQPVCCMTDESVKLDREQAIVRGGYLAIAYDMAEAFRAAERATEHGDVPSKPFPVDIFMGVVRGEMADSELREAIEQNELAEQAEPDEQAESLADIQTEANTAVA